jgi:hypothetical protein
VEPWPITAVGSPKFPIDARPRQDTSLSSSRYFRVSIFFRIIASSRRLNLTRPAIAYSLAPVYPSSHKTMASKTKDMRRADLSKLLQSYQVGRNVLLLTHRCPVIPYQEPASKGDNAEFASTISSTLPMAAIFLRNRYVGW